MLKPGDTAPEFALLDDAGQRRTLADLLAPGPIVLYFYPADFTPVCTAEACAFRDAGAELTAAGARVVGVAGGSPESKGRFKAKHRLNFTLLADEDGAVARAYGARGLFGILPFGPRRVTYVIGRDARVLDAYANELSGQGHAAFVRRALKAMSAG